MRMWKSRSFQPLCGFELEWRKTKLWKWRREKNPSDSGTSKKRINHFLLVLCRWSSSKAKHTHTRESRDRITYIYLSFNCCSRRIKSTKDKNYDKKKTRELAHKNRMTILYEYEPNHWFRCFFEQKEEQERKRNVFQFFFQIVVVLMVPNLNWLVASVLPSSLTGAVLACSLCVNLSLTANDFVFIISFPDVLLLQILPFDGSTVHCWYYTLNDLTKA